MANIGKLSKPFKSNPAIAQATPYVGGVPLFQVPWWVRPRVDAFVVRPKTKRDAMVCFACAVCKTGFGLCRFTELRDGIVRSCSCLEKEENRAYQARQVNKISASDLRKIYDDRRSIGIPATIAKWGITKSTLDHACKDKHARLTRKPLNIQSEIYVLTNVLGVEAAMAKFELNHAEIVAICGIVRKRKATEKAEAIAAWNAMPAEQKDEIKRIIAEAKPMIREAVELATGGHQVQPFGWWDEGRYWGEFTTAEYSTCDRYSYFGWVAEVVRHYPWSLQLRYLDPTSESSSRLFNRREAAALTVARASTRKR
jgi:hypothetical protein